MLLGAASLVAGSAWQPAHAAQKVLKVGAPVPLTGPLAPEGLRTRNGFQTWADAANAAGGIKAGGDVYTVEIVYADYQSNTPRAVQATERLITQDKVDFLFGPFGSGAVKAASAVSEKYGVPMLAPTAASEQVYDQGFKHLFGTFAPNKIMTDTVVDIVAKQQPSIKRLAILARNDLFPLALAEDMQKSAQARGLELVYSEKFAIGTVDFSAAMTKLRGANADWVFVSGYINDIILVRKQMSEQGVSGKLLSMLVGGIDPAFLKGVGNLSENVTTMAWWDAAVSYKGVDIFSTSSRFASLYAAKYGEPPEYGSASAAVCGAILQMAIEKTGGVDRAKVRDALAATDAMTFYGPIKFGPTGQISSARPPMMQIQGGKVGVLYPPDIKDADLKLGFK